MKLWQIISGVALGTRLAGCAESANIQIQRLNAGHRLARTPSASPWSASGYSVYIRQRIALPPNATLTVTLSYATIPDALSKVIAHCVVRTDGKQDLFNSVLPFNILGYSVQYPHPVKCRHYS